MEDISLVNKYVRRKILEKHLRTGKKVYGGTMKYIVDMPDDFSIGDCFMCPIESCRDLNDTPSSWCVSHKAKKATPIGVDMDGEISQDNYNKSYLDGKPVKLYAVEE